MKKNIEITKFEKASKVENFTIVHYTKLVIGKNFNFYSKKKKKIWIKLKNCQVNVSNFKYLSQID